MYHLYIRYFEGGEDGGWQRYSLAHIPKNVQSAIEEGLVKALHLEILPLNGAASWSLPGSPRYAVLGVELTDGTRINSVPPALVKVFRRKLLESLCFLFVGLALSKSPYPWFGGVFFGYGVYRFTSALKLPRKPGWPPSSPR